MLFMFAVAILFTSSTPFQLRGEADIIIRVTINGQGPFRFLLDTGSSRSAVSPATARRLERSPTAYTRVVTPTGQSLRSLIPLEELSIGWGPPVSVMAMVAGADDFDSNVDGLIGQDVLRARRYTIDYRRRQILWHQDPAAVSAGVRLTLEWQEERFVVSLPQQSSARQLRLIPDTGSDGWVFFERRTTVLPLLAPLDTVVLRTLSGIRLLQRVLMDRIDIGRLTLTHQIATLVEKPDADAPFEDGLLPLHLFARVTFNGPEGYLAVEPR